MRRFTQTMWALAGAGAFATFGLGLGTTAHADDEAGAGAYESGEYPGGSGMGEAGEPGTGGIGAESGSSGATTGSSTGAEQAQMDRETVKKAQEALNERGYSEVESDGNWGPQTQRAVMKFQEEEGLDQTGQLDRATLAALGVEDEGAERMESGEEDKSWGERIREEMP